MRDVQPSVCSLLQKYCLTLHMAVGLGGWKRPLVERCISALCEVTGLTQSCTCFNMLLVAKTCFFRKTDKSKGLNEGLFLFLCWEQYHRFKTLVKRILHVAGRLKKWSDWVAVAAARRGALGSRTINILFVFAKLLKKGKPAAKHFPTLGAFLRKPRRRPETL